MCTLFFVTHYQLRIWRKKTWLSLYSLKQHTASCSPTSWMSSSLNVYTFTQIQAQPILPLQKKVQYVVQKNSNHSDKYDVEWLDLWQTEHSILCVYMDQKDFSYVTEDMFKHRCACRNRIWIHPLLFHTFTDPVWLTIYSTPMMGTFHLLISSHICYTLRITQRHEHTATNLVNAFLLVHHPFSASY